MPPGRKPQPLPVEEPENEYERHRAQNIMRINQTARSLGIGKLTSLLKQSGQIRKTRCGPAANQKDKEGLVDKVPEENSGNLLDNNLPMHNMQCGGTRSKRVMASEMPDQPTRLTRQRTREQQEVQASVEDNDQIILHSEEDNGTYPDDQINLHSGGQQNSSGERCRGISLGKGLNRLTQNLSAKIPVHITEGNKRPEAPMQAAKLASEGGIILRQHIPILTHWKEYKKNSAYLDEYMGKVSVNLAIDIKNKVVVDACADLLKCGQRQLRHKLKKKYFDGKPANEVPTTSPVSTITDEQWRKLVAMWSSAEHKAKCLANKRSREKVRYPHRTGSRCYLAQLAVLKQQEKYKDVPPTAIDLFKDFHCSSKTGFSEPVKDAIAHMEAIVDESLEDGQVQKTPEEAVAQVLASTKFLQNAGLQPAVAKKSSKSAYVARVQELEDKIQELQSGKLDAAALQDQVVVLEQKLVESKAAREKEIGALKKHLEDTDAILRRIFNVDK